jgi:hypothetical protein
MAMATKLDLHMLLRKLTNDRIRNLLTTRRWCYMIPVDGYVHGYGHRVSVAVEGELGHYPTGDLRTLAGDYSNDATVPWFWGPTYNRAMNYCEARNAQLGHTPERVLEIVMSTVGGTP